MIEFFEGKFKGKDFSNTVNMGILKQFWSSKHRKTLGTGYRRVFLYPQLK